MAAGPLVDVPADLDVPPMDHSVRYGGCMQRCTSVCLRHAGLEPPVLLGQFWRFQREWGPPFRHKGRVNEGVFNVWGGYFDDARDALARRGVTLTYCQGLGRERSWEWVLARMRGGQPVAVLLNSFHLPVYANFYQTLDITHVYVAAQFDPASRVVYVLNPRQEVEVWAIDHDTFMTAWSREEYEWYDIAVPDALPAYTTGALRDDLRQSVADMLPGHPGEHWNKGVPAVRRFADDLATYPERLEEQELKAVLEDGFHQLPGVREQRWLLGAKLRLVALQLGFEELHEVGRGLDAVGRSWSVARNWFVRAADSGDLRRGVQQLTEKLRGAADAEERTLLKLRELLDSPAWPSAERIDLRLREVQEPV